MDTGWHEHVSLHFLLTIMVVRQGFQYDSLVHNETNKRLQNKDTIDEENVYESLISFNLFSNSHEVLQNIATQIWQLLVSKMTCSVLHTMTWSSYKGVLWNCIWKRQSNSKSSVRNKPHTSSSLSETVTHTSTSMKSVLKGNRSILQRQITS